MTVEESPSRRDREEVEAHCGEQNRALDVLAKGNLRAQEGGRGPVGYATRGDAVAESSRAAVCPSMSAHGN